jgi:hypothetical protein
MWLTRGLWSKKKKLSTFTELGTFCTHIFIKLFSQLIFRDSINRLS